MKKLCLLLFPMLMALAYGQTSTASAQENAATTRYTFTLAGNKAGLESSTRNPDGSLQIHFEFNDRGRGPNVNEKIVTGIRARRIAAAFAAARAAGRVALIPYVVAGYPDAATSLRIALAAIDAGADLLEVGLPYSRSARRRGDPPARVAGRARRRRDPRGQPPPDRGDRRRPAGHADRADGLREPVPRRRRRRGRGRAAGAGGRRRRDRRRPHARRGRRRSRRSPAAHELAVVYLVAPTTPPARRAAIAARSGGFLYCVSLVGVTGRADVAAGDRSAA